MPSRRLLITGALLVDPVKGSAAAGDVLVEGDRIAEISHGTIEVGEMVERRDARGQLVLPGLVNAHTHGGGSFGKGLGDLWTLEVLLNAAQWTGGGMSYEDCYIAALLNAAEMIRKGATAGYDLFVQIPTPDTQALDAVARGYADAGVRVVLAPLMADLTFYEAVPGLLDALPAQAASKGESVARIAPTRSPQFFANGSTTGRATATGSVLPSRRLSRRTARANFSKVAAISPGSTMRRSRCILLS